jgi:3-phosphoshikimate 1-carboxyvinyltransferase
MIPLAMLVEEEVIFTGVKRLFERPLDVYENLFNHDKFYTKNNQLIVKGPIEHTIFEVDGSKSSQFLTGLLFALPNLKHDSTIVLTKPLKSASYVDITLDMLKKTGISIQKENQHYFIKGNQQYQSFNYEVEGDFSQAAFFMVASVLGGHITLSNLNNASKQGDKKIVDIIKEMGGTIHFDDKTSTYLCQKSSLKGIEIDLEDIPDLGPILMILASLSEGKTVFKNVERLKYKESDRLKVMLDILDRVGVSFSLANDELSIIGQKVLKGGQTFETHGDHRIAMALAIMSIRVNQPITILDEHVVSKSYPNFFEVFKSIGGYYENT